MNYTISVPEQISSGKEARHLLENAIKLDLQPIPAITQPVKRISLYLPAVLEAHLQAHPSRMVKAELMQGLICAALTEVTPDKRHELSRWSQNSVQDEMVVLIKRTTELGQITLLEASTGIGKSRVIARIVLELTKKKKCIGVFGPSLSVVYHLCNELLTTVRLRKATPPRTMIYIGKRNFVDLEKLKDILLDLDTSLPKAAKSILTWIKDGGPALTPTTKRLQKLLTVRWLVDDLVHLVPDISTVAVACDDLSKPCPGLDYYERCKAGLQEAEVIFSTHAMLCISNIRLHSTHQSLLPPLDTILIDEAHQLEEAMANVVGNQVSIHHLSASLRKGFEAGYCNRVLWQKLDPAVQRFRQALDQMEAECLIGPGQESNYPKFAQVCKEGSILASLLSKVKASKERSFDPQWFGQVENWRRALEQITAHKYTVRISYSPVLHLPSISVGPSYLRHYFQTLWQSVHSACLLSATLYVCDKPGHFSSSFIRLRLGIPMQHYYDAPPFIAPWIYSTPTLYLPCASLADAFSYPGEDQEKRHAWYDRISDTIKATAKDAAGGTLVLCNSYDDINALCDRLYSLNEEHLVVQERHDSMSRLKELFKQKAREGSRPIWLATGPAWTGLDLRDELADDPTEDNILTDLIILRLPFKQNRSVIHEARVKKLGINQEFLQTAFLLRQGIGRLVRRQGLLNRRLWFLDGRVEKKGAGYRTITAVLRLYPNQVLIT